MTMNLMRAVKEEKERKHSMRPFARNGSIAVRLTMRLAQV